MAINKSSFLKAIKNAPSQFKENIKDIKGGVLKDIAVANINRIKSDNASKRNIDILAIREAKKDYAKKYPNKPEITPSMLKDINKSGWIPKDIREYNKNKKEKRKELRKEYLPK